MNNLKYMRTLNPSIVLQEVPDEISLAFSITGCPLRCHGCHSPHLRNPFLGQRLDKNIFTYWLERYKTLISCVLFIGGDQYENELIPLLDETKKQNLKTALYTGFTSISDLIYSRLDFLKIGPFVSKLGGLDSPITNQALINTKTNENLNHRFILTTS